MGYSEFYMLPPLEKYLLLGGMVLFLVILFVIENTTKNKRK